MFSREKLDNLVDVCKHIRKEHDVTIIGSKDSIDKLSGFITNAKFEIVEENELPQDDTVYIVPIDKDKPVQIECPLSEIEGGIFKAIMELSV